MSENKKYQDLLDQVEEFGWRVEKMDSSRWKVYPPKPNEIIIVSASGDWRAYKNTLSQFRRAGFTPKEEHDMNSRTMKDAPPRLPPPLIVAQGQPEESPVAIIRQEIDNMMNSLSHISDALSRVEEDEKGVQQLKSLLRTVMK